MLVLCAAQASDCFAPPPPCTGNPAHMWRFSPSTRWRGGAGLRVGPSIVSELTEGAISKQAVASLEQQGFVVIQVFSLAQTVHFKSCVAVQQTMFSS